MITGAVKNKIDKIWTDIWAGGITNPLDVVEQMTYLMFIHDLDKTDNLCARDSTMLGPPHQSIFTEEVRIGECTVIGNQLKWSVFHDFPAEKMHAVMHEQMSQVRDGDVRGDVYKFLLSKVAPPGSMARSAHPGTSSK